MFSSFALKSGLVVDPNPFIDDVFAGEKQGGAGFDDRAVIHVNVGPLPFEGGGGPDQPPSQPGGGAEKQLKLNPSLAFERMMHVSPGTSTRPPSSPVLDEEEEESLEEEETISQENSIEAESSHHRCPRPPMNFLLWHIIPPPNPLYLYPNN